MAGPLDLRGRVIITDAGATSTLRRLQGALASVGAMARAPARALGGVSQATARLGSQASGVGGMGAGFASAYFLQQQFDFEKALNRTQAILNLTEKSAFKPLRDEIVRLAETYPAMRKEIAQGASDLAEAGMGIDTIRAVLEGTIQGSMASGESIAGVAGGVTDIIMSMALPFKSAAEQAESFRLVNDKLAASATTYNQSYEKVLLGLGRAGPVARAAGVNLHDLSAMLGTLADANFKGERGGIAMAATMLRLGAPTKKARAELARFGIDLAKFQSQTSTFSNMGAQPLVDMLQEELGLTDADALSDSITRLLEDKTLTANAQNLGTALSDLISNSLDVGEGDAENRAKINDTVARYVRGAFSTLDVVGIFREFAAKDVDTSLVFLNEVFGKYHAAKGSALISGFKSGAFDDKSLALMQKSEGATERFATIMQQGFVGAVYRMGSAWDAFLDKLANTGVLDNVTNAITSLTNFIGKLSETNPRLLEFSTYAVLAAGVMAPLGFAISGLAGGAAILAALAAGVLRLTGALTLLAKVGSAGAKLLGLGGGAAAVATGGAGLMGLGAAAGAGAVATTKGGRVLSQGMSAAGAAAENARHGARMVAGMTAGGVASGAAAAKGLQLLPRGLTAGAAAAGKAGAKVLGRVLVPLGIGMAVWDAYQGYQRNGVKGAILNPLTLGMYSGEPETPAGEVESAPSQAEVPAIPRIGAAPPQTETPGPRLGAVVPEPARPVPAIGQTLPEVTVEQPVAQPDYQASIAAAQNAKQQIESIFASINLFDAGQQAMATLAAGITAGGAQAIAAANNVAAGVRSAGQRVHLNTGPNMQPAR